MRSITFFLLVFCVAGLSGCSVDSITKRINPYRIDIRQGNYLDQEMVAQLRKGMTRDQVQFVLGRPLLVDAFHTDRWDYVYYFKMGKSQAVEERIFSVFFDEQGLLDYVEGDVVGAESEEALTEQPTKQLQIMEIQGPMPKKKK